MRLNLNLASLRYEAAGQFYFRWGMALALVVMVTLGLTFLAWSTYRNAANHRRHITELQNKIAQLDQQQKHAQAVLNQPQNQDVRDQKNFWNDVFDQRSFSWTQLISDLEKIMPARAYVISVQPTLTPERQLKLKLVIAGESHDNALELQRKMEGSERFHESSIKHEGLHTQTQGAQGQAVKSQAIWEFEIETFYTPASPAQPSPSLAKEGTG
jgi:type IV pilus assembly protein PilN